MEVLAQKSKDGYILNLLFSRKTHYFILATLTFHMYSPAAEVDNPASLDFFTDYFSLGYMQ